MNTWFLCLQQTGNNRYASVTSDPSLLDDVVIDLEFQHHANDWTWFDTERFHSLIVQDAERNPDGCMVEDWETGGCEVVDGILVAIPDFPEDDEPEIEPDGDYSHWNEEAEIVRRRCREPRNMTAGIIHPIRMTSRINNYLLPPVPSPQGTEQAAHLPTTEQKESL